jgi:hypothetical protein
MCSSCTEHVWHEMRLNQGLLKHKNVAYLPSSRIFDDKLWLLPIKSSTVTIHQDLTQTRS